MIWKKAMASRAALKKVTEALDLWRAAATRRIDALWGYDVFIAHRRSDGAEYARALFDRLSDDKISCFIDKVAYGPGDSLLVATQQHVAKSSILLLVASPQILEPRYPIDWVAKEIETYLGRQSRDPKLIVVDFGRTVEGALSSPPDTERPAFISHLGPFLRLTEDIEALSRPPTERVLSAIRRNLKGRRRDRTRLRFFQGVAALLACLLAVSVYFGFAARQEAALALRQQHLAEAALFVSESRNVLASNPEAAGLYAVQALRLAGDEPVESSRAEMALRAALAHLHGTPLRMPKRFADNADQLAFGGVTATAISADEHLLVYGTRTGQLVFSHIGGSGATSTFKTVYSNPVGWKKFFATTFASITSAQFIFRDKWLVVRTDDDVQLFDLGRGLTRVSAPPEWIAPRAFAVSPQGDAVASVSADPLALHIWAAGAAGAPAIVRSISTPLPIRSIAFSADGRTLVLSHGLSNFTVVAADGSRQADVRLPPEHVDAWEIPRNEKDSFTAISPAGRYVIVARDVFRGDVERQWVGAIWDLANVMPLKAQSFPDYEHAFSQAAFSVDGRWVALGHHHQVQLWDLSKTQLNAAATYVVSVGSQEAANLTFDPQSSKLAISTLSGPTFMVTLDHPALIANPAQAPGVGPDAPLFSRSGHFFVAGQDNQNVLRVCDASRDCDAVEGGELPFPVHDIASCSGKNGAWLIGLESDEMAVIWREGGHGVARAMSRIPWTAVNDGIDGPKIFVECSRDRRWMFVFDRSQAFGRLFDLTVKTAALASVAIPKLPGKIGFARIDPSGTWLIAGSAEGAFVADLRKRGAAVWQPLAGYQGGELSFSPKGAWLVEQPRNLKGVDRYIHDPLIRPVNSVSIGSPVGLSLSPNPIVNMKFTNDDRMLFASEARDNPFSIETHDANRPGVAVFLRDLSKPLRTAPPRFDYHRGAAVANFSPDGQWIATIDGLSEQKYKRVRLARVDNLQKPLMAFELEAPAQIFYPYFDQGGRWFILGTGAGAAFYALKGLSQVNASIGNPDFAIQSGTRITARWNLSFSPDGRWLVNQGREEPLRVWWCSPADQMFQVADAPEQDDDGSALFTVDGRYLITATAFNYGTESPTSTSIWALSESTGGIRRISMPAGGDLILQPGQRQVTAVLPTQVHTWTIAVADLVSLAQSAIGRNLTLAEWSRVLPGSPYEQTFANLPTDVSVIQDEVEQATSAASAGERSKAQAWYEQATAAAIASNNPYAAMQIVSASLSDDFPAIALEAADFSARLLPQDPAAPELRGLARLRTGDRRGIADVRAYIDWARRHGASPSDLETDIAAVGP
jgi:WD40 repeat protein